MGKDVNEDKDKNTALYHRILPFNTARALIRLNCPLPVIYTTAEKFRGKFKVLVSLSRNSFSPPSMLATVVEMIRHFLKTRDIRFLLLSDWLKIYEHRYSHTYIR